MTEAGTLMFDIVGVIMIGLALALNRAKMKRSWKRELSVFTASTLVAVWQERQRWAVFGGIKIVSLIVFSPLGLGTFDPDNATPNVSMIAVLLGLGCLATLIQAIIPTISALLLMLERPDQPPRIDEHA